MMEIRPDPQGHMERDEPFNFAPATNYRARPS
jgi:hypothetical protein